MIVFMSSVQKLIFDVETIGAEFESLDPISQEYFRKYAETDEELEEAKDRLSFSPLTGEIVAIGALNPDTMKGKVFLRVPEGTKKPLPEELEEGVVLETGNEKEVIQKFWDTAKNYAEFVSFNGRSFDVPYLLIRSAILGVQPTKNLMANRYVSSQPFGARHIDLLDQLTFYGAVRKKFNLHFWSKAFGVKSPKEDGVTGDDVKKLYEARRYLDIARYNYGDLLATKELYDRWAKYLRFDA
ncbi:3'-5' exonuclease [Candidatus Parcubacteria bacterium]|nr:MAG: 3'-5' exonuclease [Candidatus Parcubacteria bacterium]